MAEREWLSSIVVFLCVCSMQYMWNGCLKGKVFPLWKCVLPVPCACICIRMYNLHAWRNKRSRTAALNTGKCVCNKGNTVNLDLQHTVAHIYSTIINCIRAGIQMYYIIGCTIYIISYYQLYVPAKSSPPHIYWSMYNNYLMRVLKWYRLLDDIKNYRIIDYVSICSFPSWTAGHKMAPTWSPLIVYTR